MALSFCDPGFSRPELFVGCLLFLVVHNNNDFITILPRTEGMLTPGVSAADVRLWTDLGAIVPNNMIPVASPVRVCPLCIFLFPT